QICSEKGTTPTAVALKLGLSRGNVASWRKGCDPSINILTQLVVELNCSADYLLGLDTEPNRKGSLPMLSKNEKECLYKFRRLNDTEQGKILERMEMLLEKNDMIFDI
ncbi:MAG: hypothetical protein K2N26_09420, partial [Oscillospiraceae bacterium]|nr:hypothetical protein [Oscillospiraceae bacterium]